MFIVIIVIQANINKFSVTHRPYERLKLRAGINTGPVIAGVQSVGIKMPRSDHYHYYYHHFIIIKMAGLV